MFTRGLSKQTQENLAVLKNAALSLHYGHRFSNDLDFFSATPESSSVISSTLLSKGKLDIFQHDEGTFNGQLNEVKISFFRYPYALLKPTVQFDGINVASIEDLACMKIDAISSRGTKRDFVDLFTICHKEYQLADLMKLFEVKYENVHFTMLHILKSLVYFDDAEDDVIPQMLEKVAWGEIKGFFIAEVRKLTE